MKVSIPNFVCYSGFIKRNNKIKPKHACIKHARVHVRRVGGVMRPMSAE